METLEQILPDNNPKKEGMEKRLKEQEIKRNISLNREELSKLLWTKITPEEFIKLCDDVDFDLWYYKYK